MKALVYKNTKHISNIKMKDINSKLILDLHKLGYVVVLINKQIG